MRHPPSTIDIESTVSDAAQDMREHDVGALVVVEEGRLAGVVTDRDLVTRCMAEGREARLTSIRDIMSVSPIRCMEDQPLNEAVKTMTENGIMRAPVVNQRDEVVGSLSLRQLVRSVPMRKLARRKSRNIRFYKKKTSSTGQRHDVALQTIYVVGAQRKDEVEAQAKARFERNYGVSDWSLVANAYSTEDVA
jgi:CBS domain-containing protein